MLLKRQQQRVTALADELQVKSASRRHTKRVLKDRRQRFFTNPVNLLLPFTVGALATLLASRRKRVVARKTTVKHGSSVVELVKAGTTLWAMAMPFREQLKEQRLQKLEQRSSIADDPPA